MIVNWKSRSWQLRIILFLVLSGTTAASSKRSVLAQIIPDGTLDGESSTLVPLNGQTEQIEGGATRGSNLFHSFQEFNINEGRGAYFANPALIENIFSRVTGSNPSEILGTLGVLGNANLFFINPNGIIFGPNAQLDIRGSLVTSTANSLLFPDGNQFSATNPETAPLLTIDVPIPIGLQFEGEEPGAIINAGDLEVGGNLTLVGGTVASTGQLLVPEGQVAVSTVSGVDVDGNLSVVQLGDTGRILGQEIQPLTGAGIQYALSALSWPELVANGGEQTGLTVNGEGTVELTKSGKIISVGDITIEKLIAQGAKLSANHNLTLVESKLGTVGDLKLLAQDTVRVRDSVEQPFIAAAGGELLVQGNQGVDIFALNHPDSGLFSAGDLILRSANSVGGDAHYWSGGNFRIEKLDGSLGDLFSEYDPIISTQGDVSFRGYQGTSLHILAGGSVNITDSVIITGTDTEANTINPTATPELANITLSDGNSLVIEGNEKPTLDIRAGVDPTVISDSFLTGEIFTAPDFDLFFPPFNLLIEPFSFSETPSSADITIGGVLITAPDGLVYLTNQYEPDNSLRGGEIEVGAIFTGDFLFLGDSGSVIIDSRSDITFTSRFEGINSSSFSGDAGNITLIANDKVSLTGNLIDSSTSGVGKGGDIFIHASQLNLRETAVVIANTSSSAPGGDINIDVQQLIIEDGSSIFSRVIDSGSGNGGDITINATESVQVMGTIAEALFSTSISTVTLPGTTGEAGNLTLNTPELLILDGGSVSTNTEGMGNAGDLTINTKKLLVEGGAQVTAITEGVGKGGNLIVNSSESVQVIGNFNNEALFSSVLSTVSRDIGDAGDITINTPTLLVQDGAQIQAGTGGAGEGGSLTVTASESIQVIGSSAGSQVVSALSTDTSGGTGDAGDLTINTPMLLVRDGAQLQASTGLVAGREGIGNAGDLTINTRQLVIQDGAQVSTGTSGEGVGGNLTVTATELVQVIGTSAENQFPSGLIVATDGQGDAGNLKIFTPTLQIQDGAVLLATTASSTGRPGNIFVEDADSVSLSNNSSISTAVGAGAVVKASAGDQGGNIKIQSRSLSLTSGSQVTASTSGVGDAGSILVQEANSVSLTNNSLISTVVNEDAEGQGGNIDIQTRSLSLTNEAEVTASTSGQGDAGSITVMDAESVTLEKSFISTAVEQTESGELAVGEGGEITLQTNSLFLTDNAEISAATSGIGSAGSISLPNADSISLSDNSSISTEIQSTGVAEQPSNIVINTRSLSLTNGAEVTASISGVGDAGSVTVDASESIILTQGAQVTTSTLGTGNAGTIKLQTPMLSLTENSQVSSTTSGEGNAGSITVMDVESVTLDRSSISTAVEQTESGELAVGEGGEITLQTNSLFLTDNAEISAATSGIGSAGNISVPNADTVFLSDNSSISTEIQSTGVAEQPSNIVINTRSLSLTNGAEVTASISGVGDAGSVTVDASDSIVLSQGAQVTTSTSGTGNAGSINLSANQVTIQDSEVSAFTSSTRGDAGSLQINAPNSVTITGTGGLSVRATNGGTAGNLTVDTGELTLAKGASVTVSSPQGLAGNLDITANSLFQNQGEITAETGLTDEVGANITLKISDIWYLENESLVSATALGDADGGNISIDTKFILAFPPTSLKGSDIKADAVDGNGGRIEGTTAGIFGIQFRGNPTPLNDFTVSSEFGLPGEFAVEDSGIDPTRGLLTLPEEPINTEISQSCQTVRGQETVKYFEIGRGGSPPTPEEPLNADTALEDWIDLESKSENSSDLGTTINSAHSAKTQFISIIVQ